mmetsp:Transcript_13996/g.30478  ORF Transcript_13996/g.30478 Transcript_13996/m.30478 type:complete len:423 (+) Transcript_13996:314-1582(+)
MTLFGPLICALAITSSAASAKAIIKKHEHVKHEKKQRLRALSDVAAQSMPTTTAVEAEPIWFSTGYKYPLKCGEGTELSADGWSCEVNPCLAEFIEKSEKYLLPDGDSSYAFVFTKGFYTFNNLEACGFCDSIDGLAVGSGGGGARIGGGGGAGGAYERCGVDIKNVDKIEIEVGAGGAGGDGDNSPVNQGYSGERSFIKFFNGGTRVERIEGAGGGGGDRDQSNGEDGMPVITSDPPTNLHGQGGGGGGAGRIGPRPGGDGGDGVGGGTDGFPGGTGSAGDASAGGAGSGEDGKDATNACGISQEEEEQELPSSCSGLQGGDGGRGTKPALASCAKDVGLITTDSVAAGGGGAGKNGGGDGGDGIGGNGGMELNDSPNWICTAGMDNTGSGGGGGIDPNLNGPACAGANGLVVIKFKKCGH